MKLNLKPGERQAFSKSQRKLKKKIAKAIRHHKKRSHFRKQLSDEWNGFYGAIFGPGRLATIMSYTAHKRRKRLAAAVSDKNPLLEKLKELGVNSFATCGRVISAPIEAEDE